MRDPAQRLWQAVHKGPVPREYAVRDLRRIYASMAVQAGSGRLNDRGKTLMRKAAFAALIDAQEVTRDGLTPIGEVL